MANLFSDWKLSNKPHRSSFDLSSRVTYTSKTGQLLPLKWWLTNPGDKFKINIRNLTRTQQINTAAYTQIKEYFDIYFVPLRQLWKSFDSCYMQLTDNPVQASSFYENHFVGTDMPYITTQLCYDYVNGQRLLAENNYQIYSVGKDEFGFYRCHTSSKLLSYLGYIYNTMDIQTEEEAPWFSQQRPMLTYRNNTPLNVFPLLAYHKIYNDYFRFSQWESAQPKNYNVDYSNGGQLIESLPEVSINEPFWMNPNIFDLHYCNFPRDMFFGILPNSQQGDQAVIESVINGTIPSQDVFVNSDVPLYAKNIDDSEQHLLNAISNKYEESLQSIYGLLSTEDGAFDFSTSGKSQIFGKVASGINIPELKVDYNNLKSEFSVLQLRQKEYLQRYKEIAQSRDQDYKEQMYAHWGVQISSALSGICRYVGGVSNFIDIDEVVSNNIDVPAGNYANIAGKGVGVANKEINFECDEVGILMCIYHNVPRVDYDITGYDPMLLKTSVFDYAISEFDNIGMQEIPYLLLDNTNENWINQDINQTMGYVPRYFEYKTDIDRIKGGFQSYMKNWVTPITPDYVTERIFDYGTAGVYNKGITSHFFKVNPHILNPIFIFDANSSEETDQFFSKCSFDVKVVRNLSEKGMPY